MSKVKLYSTPFCPACKALKQELRKCGVEFEELDVTTNDEATRKLVERKIMAVPVLEIDGELTVGYDKKWVHERFKCYHRPTLVAAKPQEPDITDPH